MSGVDGTLAPRTSSRLGMVYDRALTPTLLDVGLRIAAEHGDSSEARRLLTIALRDHVSEQEAQGKTKKCVSRAWVAPPSTAAKMIRWAIDNLEADPTRNVLHYGALLATFPFVGAVTGLVGQILAVERIVVAGNLRFAVRARLGDRSTIDVGARKVLTTLKYLGLLTEVGGGLTISSPRPPVPVPLQPWLAHALLLTRQMRSISLIAIDAAPELSFFTQSGAIRASNYPLVERHEESSGPVLAG